MFVSINSVITYCIRKTVLKNDGRQPMLYIFKFILLHININIKLNNYFVIIRV